MAVTKVMVCDDSATDLTNIKNIVESAGCIPVTATNGAEAVDKAKTEKPDIIFLDIIMPEMSGKDVLGRLKEIDPDLCVLLSSGYSIDWQAREMMENGCNGFVQKPFKLKALSTQVRKILEDSQ